MSVADLESTFPNLVSTGYRVTSPESIDYNCLAWVVGDQTKWWQPEDGNYTGIPFYWHREGLYSTIDTYLEQYRAEGFEITDSANFEPEFDKIAMSTHATSLPTWHWYKTAGGDSSVRGCLKGRQSK